MQNIAVVSALLEDQHRMLPVVHKTGARIDLITEIVQQVAQTARKAPFDSRCWDIMPAVIGQIKILLGYTECRFIIASTAGRLRNKCADK